MSPLSLSGSRLPLNLEVQGVDTGESPDGDAGAGEGAFGFLDEQYGHCYGDGQVTPAGDAAATYRPPAPPVVAWEEEYKGFEVLYANGSTGCATDAEQQVAIANGSTGRATGAEQEVAAIGNVIPEMENEEAVRGDETRRGEPQAEASNVYETIENEEAVRGDEPRRGEPQAEASANVYETIENDEAVRGETSRAEPQAAEASANVFENGGEVSMVPCQSVAALAERQAVAIIYHVETGDEYEEKDAHGSTRDSQREVAEDPGAAPDSTRQPEPTASRDEDRNRAAVTRAYTCRCCRVSCCDYGWWRPGKPIYMLCLFLPLGLLTLLSNFFLVILFTLAQVAIPGLAVGLAYLVGGAVIGGFGLALAAVQFAVHLIGSCLCSCDDHTSAAISASYSSSETWGGDCMEQGMSYVHMSICRNPEIEVESRSTILISASFLFISVPIAIILGLGSAVYSCTRLTLHDRSFIKALDEGLNVPTAFYDILLRKDEADAHRLREPWRPDLGPTVSYDEAYWGTRLSFAKSDLKAAKRDLREARGY